MILTGKFRLRTPHCDKPPLGIRLKIYCQNRPKHKNNSETDDKHCKTLRLKKIGAEFTNEIFTTTLRSNSHVVLAPLATIKVPTTVRSGDGWCHRSEIRIKPSDCMMMIL